MLFYDWYILTCLHSLFAKPHNFVPIHHAPFKFTGNVKPAYGQGLNLEADYKIKEPCLTLHGRFIGRCFWFTCFVMKHSVNTIRFIS